VLIAFLIAIIALSIFLYPNQVENRTITTDEEINFYSNNLNSSGKKIFLIGSSHVMPLNTTFIQEYLSSNGANFTVYNLSIGGDSPKERLKAIDHIILTKPEVIVYAIAERDFRTSIPINEAELPSKILPDPRPIFNQLVWKTGLYELDFLKNPKYTTLTTINNFVQGTANNTELIEKSIEEFVPYPSTPFTKITRDDIPILNDRELNDFAIKTRVGRFYELGMPSENQDVLALKEIIHKFKENNIKIALFTSPYHKSYLDITPDAVTENFDIIVEDLLVKSDVTVHPLLEKFKDLKIWNDPAHVAVNDKALIYSEEIAKLILKEL